MKELYDVEKMKNIGQYFVCPLIGIIISIFAVRAGKVTGYFAVILGFIMFCALTALCIVVYDRLLIQRMVEKNEKERARLKKMIEEENDPDAYPEYDD